MSPDMDEQWFDVWFRKEELSRPPSKPSSIDIIITIRVMRGCFFIWIICRFSVPCKPFLLLFLELIVLEPNITTRSSSRDDDLVVILGSNTFNISIFLFAFSYDSVIFIISSIFKYTFPSPAQYDRQDSHWISQRNHFPLVASRCFLSIRHIVSVLNRSDDWIRGVL